MRRLLVLVVGSSLMIAGVPGHAASLTTLATFNFANGAYPVAGLIRDDAGTFYGTTSSGGAFGNGAVFSLTTNGTLTTLFSFNGASDGGSPQAGLVRDAAGTLYGTTFSGGTGGGPFGFGTVFSLTSSGTFSTLANFNGANGSAPSASLFRDPAGNLYGTTAGGGAFGLGTVFSLDSSGTLTTLVHFDGTNGARPYSNLISDGAGTFYGTTFEGGGSNRGTVFSLTSTGVLTTLTDFPTSSSRNPIAGLFRDQAGTLFGTTTRGGPLDDGSIFSLSADGTLTTLVAFGGDKGSRPSYGPLIVDPSGMLYGTTEYGGGIGVTGTVFSVTTSGALTTLVSFSEPNGFRPAGGLFRDDAGNLFGTTVGGGGQNGFGTVFKISGLQTGAVPEPASWAMMVVAFGLVGAVARRQRLKSC